MRILISGATGYLGTGLSAKLRSGGHTVVRLVRSSDAPGILWDPYARQVDASRLEGFDAVVNLSGERIGNRWTRAKKRRMASSRIEPGRFLVELVGNMKKKPAVYVSASGINYYGDRGDEELTETSSAGSGYLADLCKQWEAVSSPLESEGMRVVRMRTGLVLSADGEVLQRMMLPFKLGLGGPIGSGKQWWSWIAYEDQIGAYDFAITSDKINGAVNSVAPNPVRNKAFVKALGKAISRPAVMPLPGFAVKLLFGEMGDTLLVGGQRVRADALENAGFTFGQKALQPYLYSLF